MFGNFEPKRSGHKVYVTRVGAKKKHDMGCNSIFLLEMF